MEIPDKLKKLYKHWEKHTKAPRHTGQVSIDLQVLSQIVTFVNKRLSIFEKKTAGQPRPYSDDDILNSYRFCNIYRELDRQTIFYHTLLKPYENDFPLWLLNMLFCRSVCKTETIERVGLLSFEESHNQEVYMKLKDLESPKYGTAYVFPISVIQKSEWNTREKFFCYYYPTKIKKMAEIIFDFQDISVVDALKRILPEFGFNLKFLWTEVLIDVAYQYPQLINLFKEFPIGPGSIPTMELLSKSSDPIQTNVALTGLPSPQINLLTYNGRFIPLSAENWEGIGCEFRKYSNLKKGLGRKRMYKIDSLV